MNTWVRYGRSPILLAAAVAILLAAAVAGCSSSKPAYCSDATNLQNSVKSLNVSGGISALHSQVTMIQANATTLVNSAKSDFPTETSAITSSVDALTNSVTALASDRTAANIATVTKDAANVGNSVNSFNDATSSQCG
jgi:signal transduction protein with GAF and PtsI domain